VLDLGSRRLVGFAMGEAMPWERCPDPIDMAITTRCGEVRGMIFHHDRDSQYLSKDFRAHCGKLRIVQSVGRVGSCHDNSPAEFFWVILKRELISRAHFETRAEAQHAITAWIRHDNTTRLHSSLGNLPPIEPELGYGLQALEAAEPRVRQTGGQTIRKELGHEDEVLIVFRILSAHFRLNVSSAT